LKSIEATQQTGKECWSIKRNDRVPILWRQWIQWPPNNRPYGQFHALITSPDSPRGDMKAYGW